MNLTLGLRTLLLIAFVAAATTAVLHHGLGAASDPTASAMLMVAHN
jgi:hypothetical protein